MEVSGNDGVWCAVVNSFAASRDAGALWAKVEEHLAGSGVPYISLMSGDAGNVTTLSLNACREGYRRLVAVGGDGTVHDVVNGISSYISESKSAGEKVCFSDFTLAVIPLGSGNDWVKTVGVPLDIKQSVALLKEGRVGRQDIVRVSILNPDDRTAEMVVGETYMVNVGGIGLDARVCVRVNKDKTDGKRGKILYVKALCHCIMHRVPASAKVVCDDKVVFDGPFISIAFGIGKYSGGGMRQTPDALIDDGMLDMTVIPDLPMLKIAKEAPKLFTGKLGNVRELAFARGRSMTVYSDEPLEVDGEVVGEAPVRFDVLEDQLNVVMPL